MQRCEDRANVKTTVRTRRNYFCYCRRRNGKTAWETESGSSQGSLKRYVPTLRAGKLGSTGVKKVVDFGAPRPKRVASRRRRRDPAGTGKGGDALTQHRITRGDRASQNAGIIEIQPVPVTSEWH
jgi:hypothetical protein